MESAPTDLMVVLKFVCRGGYYPPVYDNPSAIFLRKCHLPLHKGGVCLVLVLLFGVIFLDCRGRHPWRPVYKNIIVFRADDQWSPLPICATFDVFACRGGVFPPDFFRVVEGADPYRFYLNFVVLPVGEDIILPCMTILPSFSCENATSLYTREAFFWFSPYYLVSSFLIVGDDILGVPFVRHNVINALKIG